MYFIISRKMLFHMAILTFLIKVTSGVKPGQYKHKRLGVAERRIVSEKFRDLSPAKVEQAKSEAVKSVEVNMIQMLQALSSQASSAPAGVKADVTQILKAVQLGQLTGPIKTALPKFLMKNPRGNPAKQLEKLLSNLQENKNGRSQLLPLDGLMKFLRSNMGGTNTLFKKLVSGSPDLLKNAMPALLAPMGDLNESLDGTMTSLSDLLGGLMGGM